MPLHPTKYAELLGEKLEKHKDINVWLVNTGWSGGAYGVGSRISLKYTRSIITAAMNGELNHVNYEAHPIFGILMPDACPGVPSEILNPKNTWADKEAYDKTAYDLARRFAENFKEYESHANDEMLAAAPKQA